MKRRGFFATLAAACGVGVVKPEIAAPVAELPKRLTPVKLEPLTMASLAKEHYVTDELMEDAMPGISRMIAGEFIERGQMVFMRDDGKVYWS